MVVKSDDFRIEYDEETTMEICAAEMDEDGRFSSPVYPVAKIHCIDRNNLQEEIVFERVDAIHFKDPGDMSIDMFGDMCRVFSETREGFEIEGHDPGTEGYYNAVYIRRAKSED